MRQALLVLATLAVIIIPIRGQSFVDASAGLPRVIAWGNAIGDYDADGRMDLLSMDVATETHWGASLYKNTTNGFAKQTLPSVQNNQGLTDSFWGDENGDGLLDMLLVGMDAERQPLCVVLRQNADGTFASPQPPLPGQPLAWSDLNNDGRLDIAASPFYANGLIVHWREANGSYSTSTYRPERYIQQVNTADLDSDGDTDLILNARQEGRVFRNDGFRRFTDTGTTLKSALLRDMNADGLLDAVYSIEVNPVVTTYAQFNRGAFRFEEETLPLKLLHRISSSADFNGDSLPDFFMHANPLAIGSDYRPVIYFNAGGTNFQSSGWVFPYVMEVKGSELADFDNDGDIDVLAYGDDTSGENRRRVFRNNNSVQVAVLTPTNLNAVVKSGAVRLGWDALVPSRYSYNLRVGTQSGAQDILAAASRADGTRLIPTAGNAGLGTQKLLFGLAPGTYYWSVQAVDWGFRGSPFAAEGSFSVPEPGALPPAPSISEIPNLFTDEDEPTTAISFSVGPAETVADMQVTIESDNPTLVPAHAAVISGPGSERTLQVTPATNQNGSATLTVRVTDLAGRSATRSLVLSVLAINDPPVIADIPSQVVYQGNPSLIVPLEYSDVETLPISSGLVVTAQTSDPEIIPQSSLVTESDPREFPWFPGLTNALEIRLPTNKTGSATITVTVSDRSVEVSKSFVLTILPAAFSSTNAWTNTAAINVPGADFNNDGRLDLILTTPAKMVPELYTNSGAGFVATGVILPTVQSDGRMVAADFNRDNRLDCLIINSTAAHLLTNNGGTNFSALIGHGLPRLEFPEITPADLDQDGDVDLILNGTLNSSALFRFWYNENGVFRQNLGPLSGFRGASRVADVDLDGWNDLILVGSMSGTRPTNGIFRGFSRGNYVFEPLPANIGSASAFGLLDVNSDGRAELWIETGGNVELYAYGSGGFEFVQKLEGWVGGWGDFDNDGDFDLLARIIRDGSERRSEFSFRKYRNESDFTFGDRGDPLHDAFPGKVHVADFNNDNSVDLIAGMRNPITGQPQGARLYLNKTTTLNSPPSAPRDLVATFTNGVARFSWSAASDLNQRSGLTYNVRIGTQPGGSDVLPPLSLANGRRLVPTGGNADGGFTLMITNLTREIYYWSVQAVDASFKGGAFATEQKLIIETPGNEPPTILAPASVTSAEDTKGSFEFAVNDDRTPLADLTVRVFPEDPLLLPLKNITVEGTGSVRTVSFRPATNSFGSTGLTILATDAVGFSATNFVRLSITNVNDAPRIAPITNQFSNSWKEDIRVQVRVTDSDNTVDQFAFEVSSDNSVLIPPANVTFQQTNDTWVATIRAASEAPGTANLTFTVFDPERASSTASFQVAYTNRVFRLAEQEFAGVRSGSMAWGDMDNDGDLDLALTGQGVTQTVFYKNLGSGLFEMVVLGIPAVDGGGVEWGDYDNDGDLDLLVHGRETAYIARIYRNDGAGNLTVENTFPGLYGPAALGDYDRDGDLDLISSGQTTFGGYVTSLYRNDRGQFNLTPHHFGASYGAHWLDVNMDGALDLRSSRLDVFGWRDVLFTQQDGEFVLTSTPPWPGMLVEWADLDLDGTPDAVANNLNRGSIGDLLVLKNTNGLLSSSQLLLDGFRQDGTALGDFNNDGFLDLFVSGYGENFVYRTRLFRNETNGNFGEVQTPLPNLMFSTASWADIENDGDLDLLINGQRPSPQSGYITQLYRNDYSPSNQPPSAPTNLKAFYTSEGLLLEWDAGVDQNQAGGLTYNVAIGTAPGKWDVLAPMAKASGWRMVPRAGNNAWLRWKLLTGVEIGKTYYATVQAVDNAFAGSAFAPEVSITIGQPPRLDWQFTATIEEDQVFEGEFQVSGGEDTNYVFSATSSNPLLASDSQIEIISRDGRRFVKVTPDKGDSGTALITIFAFDGKGGRAARSFMLTVTPRNLPPVVASQTLTLLEDTAITFSLGASDPEGGALQVTNTVRPRYGTLSASNDGFIYRPMTNFFGSDRCIFVVSDDQGQTNSAEITFHVTSVPDVAQAGFEMNYLFDGTILFKLLGEPYQPYEVEVSSDLLNWSLLGVWRSPSGELPFTGNRGAPQQMLFIRAKPSL